MVGWFKEAGGFSCPQSLPKAVSSLHSATALQGRARPRGCLPKNRPTPCLPPAALFGKFHPMPQRDTPWPHAPTHLLGAAGAYFITAATYQKAHHFRGRPRLEVLHRGLLTVACEAGWQLEAWAVFSNHYHFVASSPETGADSLRPMLSRLHERTAKWINRLDATPGRKVWAQLARLPPDLREKLPRPPRLHPPQPHAPRPRPRRQPISLVLCRMV